MNSPSKPEAGSLAPWQTALLGAALSMPAHALLLHGPSGLGQYEIALAWVKAMLCEDDNRGAQDPSCGLCPSCRQIQAGGHTDLVVLMPETFLLKHGWPLSEKAQKEIDEKKRKVSQEIRIEAVRDALAFSQLSRGRGRAKVIWVYPAEAMNHASANALLKTLEEPSASLRFILVSTAPQALLPTVRSRCQAIALLPPAAEQAQAWLQAQRPDLSDAQRQLALQACGDRPMDALSAIEAGLLALWSDLPRIAQKGQASRLSGWATAQVLDALQKLCHDLWALKLSVQPRFFQQQDLPKAPPARALAAWSEQLKNTARTIDHPFKSELLIEDLLQQAKVCINSRV